MSVSNEPPEQRPPRPRWLLLVMILMSVVYAGLFAFSLFAAAMSVMVFDAGETPQAWAAFGAFVFFPLLILASVTFAWCGFGFRRYLLIGPAFFLPIIYGVVFWFSLS